MIAEQYFLKNLQACIYSKFKRFNEKISNKNQNTGHHDANINITEKMKLLCINHLYTHSRNAFEPSIMVLLPSLFH